MYQSLQGNLGLGKAIEYFTSHNIMVAIPLNDTQKYDLVVDINGLQRVSVKTSRQLGPSGAYSVQLRNTGGGGSGGGGQVRQVAFDNTACDYVFIYTGCDDIYFIPSNEIEAKNSINVGNKYTEYKVLIKSFGEWIQENME